MRPSKHLSLVLAILLILGAGAMITTSPAEAYSDVPNSHWAGQMISELDSQKAFTEIVGSSQSFLPDQAITRGEFITLTVKVCAPEQTGTLTGMKDMAQIREELLPYLGAAQVMGIFNGSLAAEGIYSKANDPITRQEASAVLGRLLKMDSETDPEFTDADSVAEYAEKYVTALSNAGIIRGYTDGSFRPLGNITRAESVSLVYYARQYSVLNENELVTFAGSGGGVEYLDGSLRNARLGQPEGICEDGSGGFYLFDTSNNLIRRISGSKVTTATGTVYARDVSGDALGGYQDGTASAALLNRPSDGVRTDGQLIFTDSDNNTVRALSNNKVYTFSGNSNVAGYANGEPGDSSYSAPSAIAADSAGNLYVADTLNNCIRKIDSKQNSTLLAGVPGKSGLLDGDAAEALFREPCGIAVSPDGSEVYVADTGNQRIRLIQNGTVSTLAGSGAEIDTTTDRIAGGFMDGNGSQARFLNPRGLCLAEDVLFLADSGNNLIRAVTPSGRVITIAGTGDAGCTEGNARTAALNGPTDVCWYNGALYLTDTLNNRVCSVTVDLTVLQ